VTPFRLVLALFREILDIFLFPADFNFRRFETLN
jgi:hypothetical protein